MVHRGQISFRVSDDSVIGQLDEEYDPELVQSDPISCKSVECVDPNVSGE